MIDKNAIPKEVLESAIRLNLIWQIHDDNQQSMNLLSTVATQLAEDSEMTLAPEDLRHFLGHLADTQQTIDALLHVCRKYFCAEADESAATLTKEESKIIKTLVKESEPWQKMHEIVNESEEERTQRLLLEMLGIYE